MVHLPAVNIMMGLKWQSLCTVELFLAVLSLSVGALRTVFLRLPMSPEKSCFSLSSSWSILDAGCSYPVCPDR